jgi:hypothetical protein
MGNCSYTGEEVDYYTLQYHREKWDMKHVRLGYVAVCWQHNPMKGKLENIYCEW